MKTTAENVAGSGLNQRHLRTIFNRHGEDGILSTFTVKNCDGQPRVTNVKRTLETVVRASQSLWNPDGNYYLNNVF